jgi:exodeoxyribonuclease VII large subunit
VWTGIGHETDVSILDHVANRYFKTPTAVAEELVARFIEVKRHLEEAENRFRSTWAYRLTIDQKYIERVIIGINQGTRKLIDATMFELKSMAGLLSSRVLDRLSNAKTNLTVSEKVLKSAPINHIKNQKRLLAEGHKRVLISGKRQINDQKKDLLNWTRRFQFERFQQQIVRERVGLVAWKENLLRIFNTRVLFFQKELSGLRYRFYLETILKHIESEKMSLVNKLAAVKASDPLNILKRGFSLVYKNERQLVKSIETVSPGETIKTVMQDGAINSKIELVKRT